MTDFAAPCPKSVDNLTLNTGNGSVTIPLPCNADLFSTPVFPAPLSAQEVLHLLNTPVMSETLPAICEKAQQALVILPFRSPCLQQVLTPIFTMLTEAEMPLTILFATGTTQQITEESCRAVMGDTLFDSFCGDIALHDADNHGELAFFGTTKSKTTILLNQLYLEHDLVIPVSITGYHPFTGFSGGRDMILPGLAARKAAGQNMKNALNPETAQRRDDARPGELKKNPAHDDLVAAVMITRARKTFFAVNLVTDRSGAPVHLTAGDLFISHIESAAKLKELTAAVVTAPYDAAVISCGGAPADATLQAALHHLDRAAPALCAGATVLLVADCAGGLGSSTFANALMLPDTRSIMEPISRDYQPDAMEALLLKGYAEQFRIFLISLLPVDVVTRSGLHPASGSDTALLLAGASRILAVEDASQMLFAVADEEGSKL